MAFFYSLVELFLGPGSPVNLPPQPGQAHLSSLHMLSVCLSVLLHPPEPKMTKEERIAEKKAKRRVEEQPKDAPAAPVSEEDQLVEKLRQRKLQEDADLAVAMETFSVAPSSGLDAMDPKTEEEFDKFRETLCDKITKYEVSVCVCVCVRACIGACCGYECLLCSSCRKCRNV